MNLQGERNMKNIIEDMRKTTEEYNNLFNKDNPLFTIALPHIKKMSLLSGYEAVKEFFIEQNPTTIDLREREFTFSKDGIASETQDIWTLEFNGQPVYMLRNNKIMNRGQYVSLLKRIKFAN